MVRVIIILLLFSCSTRLPGKSLYAIAILENMTTEVNHVFAGPYTPETYLPLWNEIESLTQYDLKRRGSKKFLQQDRKIQLMIITFRTIHSNNPILSEPDAIEFRNYMKEIIAVRMQSEYW